jgi:serine/threonine protein kinase
MICPYCSYNNRPGARFCARCGSAQSSTCWNCGKSLRAGAKFCDQCGTPQLTTTNPPVAIKICPNCHVRNRATARFCQGCRQFLVADFADFTIQREIGQGGMGTVYLAIDKETNAQVAIKLLPQSQPLVAQLFEDSACIQQLVQHPNIAPILRIGRIQDVSFLVQPYYPNGSFDHWFRQIDLIVVIQVFRSICFAVQAAHEQNCIHGDIKPSNVLIDASGKALLTDFVSSESLFQLLQTTGARWGTPAYMPPEALSMRKVPDTASDIYALGVLLFEAVRGYLPRQVDERVSLAHRIQSELPLRVEPRFAWLNDVIRRSTNPDPEQRFSTVQDLIESIQEPPQDYQWPTYYSEINAWLEFDDGRSIMNLGESTYSIGSSINCDVVVQSPDVLERHAEIDYREGVFLLRPIHERAKVYLNDEAVLSVRVLQRGDSIRIGSHRLNFVLPAKPVTRRLEAVSQLPIAWLESWSDNTWPARIEIQEGKNIIDIQGTPAFIINATAGELSVSSAKPSKSLSVNHAVAHGTSALSEGDVISWKEFDWKIRYAREEWFAAIDKQILRHFEISERDLTELSMGYRAIALREYFSSKADLDIRFDPQKNSLQFPDGPRMKVFLDVWWDIQLTFYKRIGVEVSTELIGLINERLSLNKVVIHSQRRLGDRYGRFLIFPLEIGPIVQGLKLPASIPLVVTDLTEVSEDDLASLMQAIKTQDATPRLVVVIFLEGIAVSVFQDLAKRLHPVKVLPLTRDQVQQLLFSRDPRRKLRVELLARVDLLQISPFVVHGATDRSIFFGREQEIARIVSNIRTKSFVIVGGRRYGKTSLLMRLHEEHLPNSGFWSLYVDCARVAAEDFLKVATTDWNPPPSSSLPSTMGALLQSMPSDKPIAVLLDEADKLIAYDRANEWTYFYGLRALANHGRAQFVFSGERILHEAISDSFGPFFNFANQIIVGPLELQPVYNLITQPMRRMEIELIDERQIVHQIYDFTSGHPNIVQRLCSHLIDRINQQNIRRISARDVESVIEDPDFIRTDFLETYFSQASVLEHLCALLMATDSTLQKLDIIQQVLISKGINATLNQVNAALERLVDLRGILSRTSNGYEFAAKSIPHVASKSQRLLDYIALRREVFAQAGDISLENAPSELRGRPW